MDAGVWNCKMNTAAGFGEWICGRFDDCQDRLRGIRLPRRSGGRPLLVCSDRAPLDPGRRASSPASDFTDAGDRAGWGPVERDADPTWLFTRVPESKTVKNRLHLDVIAADPEVKIERLVGLGATRVADRDEYGYTWTLMADPEGNEFDLGKAL